MNRRDARELLISILVQQRNNNRYLLVDPKLRYLTDAQAREWIKVSESRESKFAMPENTLLQQNLGLIFKERPKSIILVDLGCGDGLKTAKFIQDLNETEGIEIDKYVPIDINRLLISEAVKNVIRSTAVEKKQCLAINLALEDIDLETLSKNIGCEPRTFLFLGNTFNNFPGRYITKLLANISRPNDKVLIGIRYAQSYSQRETSWFLREYDSYGPEFTYTIGRLLGLKENNVKRRITFNKQKHRIEIWLDLLDPSPIMRTYGLNVRSLLVGFGYKPTLASTSRLLAQYFRVIPFADNNTRTAIFLCSKKV